MANAALVSPASRLTWFITRKYPPRVGGMERLSYELTTRLAQRRPARIFALRKSALWLPPFIVLNAVRLLAAAATGRVSALHLGDPVLSPLGWLARKCGIPVCVTVHGLDVTYANPLYRLWLRMFFRDFNAYVCISTAARDAAIARGAPSHRTSVVGIGIAVPALGEHAPRARNVLLFIGRLVPRKGVEWFVRAVMPALLSRRRDLRLAIIGEGPERERIARSASEAGVAAALDWLGAVPDATKWSWLARASLAVMPNMPVADDIEGFGITAIEAAAAGCPLVAADLEGLHDAIENEKGGLLVPAGDAVQWISTLEALLDDPARAEALGRSARTWVERERTWDSVCDRYEVVIDEIARTQ